VQPLSRFPPSFDDSPLSYAVALFSLTLVSSISLSVISTYLLEARRTRQIDAAIGNLLGPDPWRPFNLWRLGRVTPVTIHRLVVSLLLATILCGFLPDVIVLLAWGEASAATMDRLFTFDRICDGATILPFGGAVIVLWRAAQVVDHRLTMAEIRLSLLPHWSTVRDKVKLVAVVAVIALGVTLYKAYPA
jgi:hypothetical protein